MSTVITKGNRKLIIRTPVKGKTNQHAKNIAEKNNAKLLDFDDDNNEALFGAPDEGAANGILDDVHGPDRDPQEQSLDRFLMTLADETGRARAAGAGR